MRDKPTPMKTLVTVCISFLLAGFSQTNELVPIALNIIPKPVSIKILKGSKTWKEKIILVAQTSDEKQVAGILSEQLKNKGFQPVTQENAAGKNKVILTLISDASLGKEGYTLTVKNSGAIIQANTAAGLFYGTQTLLQITDIKKETDCVKIVDYPRFTYRGMHLDVGRHMFPPAFIKKYIDLMARHKYNRFHWHLTEDQGWRIEIKKYPKLKEISAYRKETSVGKQTTRTRAQATYDGKPYGGFYTQEEVKEIVRYAAERHVTIIPEIELPGHAQAALAAYPNLGCTGGPYEVATSWGVFKDVYCAGKEETFTFLQDVLDEVLVLFPGQYIHIGGDECPKDRWKTCPQCQKRIADENVKDEHGLQSYFVQRVEKYLNSKGREIIGWDEILEGGLAPNATVMSWRGEEGGLAAAKQNHDVIMTPESWCYFDHAQDSVETEPLAIGPPTSVSKVYSYEPIPPQLTPEEARHVLGAQCNVWSEYIKTPEHAEYMVYPRAAAMAEVLWSPKEGRTYADFVQRMKTHTQRLKEWNVNYARHIEKEF
jgi:hexosaminidase